MSSRASVNASDHNQLINDSNEQTTNKIENDTQKSMTLYMDQDKSMAKNIRLENSEVPFLGKKKNTASLHNSNVDSNTNYVVKINPNSSSQQLASGINIDSKPLIA